MNCNQSKKNVFFVFLIILIILLFDVIFVDHSLRLTTGLIDIASIGIGVVAGFILKGRYSWLLPILGGVSIGIKLSCPWTGLQIPDGAFMIYLSSLLICPLRSQDVVNSE